MTNLGTGRTTFKALSALALIVFGFFLCAVVTAQTAGNRKLGRHVEISIKSAKDRYAIGEDIAVVVLVKNAGQTPIELPNPFYRDNWQPTYTVTGPSYPNGTTFSFRSAVVGDTRPNPQDVIPKLMKLAPGASVEEEIPLHEWISLKEPGTYTIAANLAWQGISASSQPLRFAIEAIQITSLSLGIDLGVAGSMGYWLEWLNRSGSGSKLYTALFLPPQRDVRGFQAHSVSPLIDTGPQAADVLSPWTTYNRQNELAKWRSWREGATLLALLTGETTPARLQLPQAPVGVIRPALMGRSGELDVFVLMSKNEIALARFSPRTADGKGEQPRMMFRTRTPRDVVAVRAAEAPGASAQRRLVAVGGNGETIVSLIRSDGAAAAVVESVTVPRVKPLADVTPALRLEADGSAQAAVLGQTDGTRRRLALMELRFGPAGKLLNAPQVTELVDLERQPRTGSVQYVVTPGAAMKAEWALLLDNGRILHPRSSAGGVSLAAPPVLPFELLPTDEATYLLTVDPKSGPTFTPL